MSVINVLSRCAGISLIVLIAASNAAAESELTLAEAEHLALEHAPALAQANANVKAAAERTVSAGRLPDPQLTLGAINVPTDTYRLNQEDMTMVEVGVRQAFPPGDTLAARTRRAEQEHARSRERLETERRDLLRQVRQTWFDLYYAERAQRLLESGRKLARRDVAAAEARRRAAQDTSRAVFQARQQLARLDERLPMLRAASERARALLARWIGEAARAPLPDALPALPAPEDFDPRGNPEWRATQAGFEAARAEVDMARQEYKPGWMLDLSYGFRQPMPDGTSRPNMVTAMVTFDLPVFRAKRQDRRLAESEAREAAARYESEDKQRELVAMHQTLRAEHDALAERVRVYEQELLPALRHEAQDASGGFARELTERRAARMKEIDAEIELLRLRVDLAKTQAELLYLTGEPQS